MERMQIRRQKAAPSQSGDLEQSLRRQMAWAAGTEQFQYRDPLYHVTESFQQNFDAMGRRHAARLGGAPEDDETTAPSMRRAVRRTRICSAGFPRPPFSGERSPGR